MEAREGLFGLEGNVAGGVSSGERNAVGESAGKGNVTAECDTEEGGKGIEGGVSLSQTQIGDRRIRDVCQKLGKLERIAHIRLERVRQELS